MKLLAIDTSSDACSAALLVDDDIVEKHVVEARAHSRILVPMIRELLHQAGLQPAGLDALVLGNGPGSFIGMRISAAVAQGLCYGADLKIVPVSSLEAVAAEVMQKHAARNVLVAQDARMGEVYVGQYRRDRHGLPEAVHEEQIFKIGPLEDVADKSIAAGMVWQTNAELVRANRALISEISAVTMPRARFMLATGQRDFTAGGAIAPELLLPAYIRTKVAEVPVQAN